MGCYFVNASLKYADLLQRTPGENKNRPFSCSANDSGLGKIFIHFHWEGSIE